MKIVATPNPVLSTSTQPIKNIDSSILVLIRDMIKILNKQTDPPGVGLAAPQIGKLLKLFVIQKSTNDKAHVFINPHILEVKDIVRSATGKEKKRPIKLEGCLSIHRIWGIVKRHSKIRLEYQDEKGKAKKEWFSGFMATIIQHEVDHLEGILFTKRVMEQNGDLYEEKKGELYKIKSI